MDRKVIIEMNNLMHYKRVEGQLVLNLKSRFRERVLEGEGYRYVNIRIDEYL